MEAAKITFSDNAMKVLCNRYLRKAVKPSDMNAESPEVDAYNLCARTHTCGKCGQVHETPEEMIERCSFGSQEFYDLLASRDFLPNSPTLFNAGTGQGTFSGCFYFVVDDTMDSILEVARKAALVLKWGGGTGFYLGNIRSKGASVASTHGRACGPVAVLEYLHAGALMITQGGKRQAAQMAILPNSHPDILGFIHCKDGGANLSTFNISVSCTDEFMAKSQDSGSPEAKLFEQIVESAWKTGDPGLYFIDHAEKANPTPWLGKLLGTNACGEVPLLDSEACNLGSINLGHAVLSGSQPSIDWSKLEKTTRLVVRYLDTVLDNNHFPDTSITEAVNRTRKIGMGVMGWADMLSLLRIHYDTEEAVKLADNVMQHITDWGHNESEKLATEKGLCPAFKEALDAMPNATASRNRISRRNATVTCIAPAGSICTIADCSSGIEPYFVLKGDRKMGDGTMITESVRVDVGNFVPHTTLQIDGMWQLRHQAAFQEHTDLAVSKTVNLLNSATREQIKEIYYQAWRLGCKGITVYRDGSRKVQVVTAPGSKAVDAYATDVKFGVQRRKMSKDAMAVRHSFSVGGMEGYLHIGLLPDGSPGELFITGANQGSTVSGLLASLSILTSMALQYGVPLETLVAKLQHVRFEPSGVTVNPDIPISPSVVAYIYRYLGLKFLNGKHVEQLQTGMLCAECGAPAIAEEGCLKCTSCGWTRCG